MVSSLSPDARSDEPDPLLGRTIAGKFLVERRLGAGAMGAVYLAQQTALDRPVALKVMQGTFAADPKYAERFHREAKAVSRLDHPNLIRVHDYGQEPDGLLYIVMEYLDCRDLHTVLAEDWPLLPARIVDLVGQMLAGLAEAHDAGVFHRDLKPENIMVLRRRADDSAPIEVVKVCDFGIAKVVAAEGDAAGAPPARRKLTTAGLVIGTPEYMSPEQARAEAYDARSDLYAVGVILYQMLTRRLPFEGKTPVEIVFKAMHGEPASLEAHGVTAAPELDPVCVKAISRAPEDRYQTAREMRAALRAAVGVAPSVPAPVGSEGAPEEEVAPSPNVGAASLESAPTRILPVRAGRRRLWTGVLASVAGAVGAMTLFAGHRSPPPGTPVAASSVSVATASELPPARDERAPAASSLLVVEPLPAASPPPPSLPPPPRRPVRDSVQPAYASLVPPPPASDPAPESSPGREAPSVAPSETPVAPTASPSATAPPPPLRPVLPSFNVATARVEVGRVKCNNAALTSGSASRALAPMQSRFTACFQAAVAEVGGVAGDGAGTLHLESDDGGYITVAQVTGGAPASAARCIERITRGMHLDVDTGGADVDAALLFHAR